MRIKNTEKNKTKINEKQRRNKKICYKNHKKINKSMKMLMIVLFSEKYFLFVSISRHFWQHHLSIVLCAGPFFVSLHVMSLFTLFLVKENNNKRICKQLVQQTQAAKHKNVCKHSEVSQRTRKLKTHKHVYTQRNTQKVDEKKKQNKESNEEPILWKLISDSLHALNRRIRI